MENVGYPVLNLTVGHNKRINGVFNLKNYICLKYSANWLRRPYKYMCYAISHL